MKRYEEASQDFNRTIELDPNMSGRSQVEVLPIV
ncbi:tetratricopeptide repeat protein [Halotia branconii]|uniref:Tetratricopeptide repeat protein n=1 Tax=Halotia branconii CENA392 TaxID=1539056 RepID=A0AAJ6NMP8_9CYAN|nr:tetratricopeptide repeat protein [Halotia branconii]WGV23228.1 tetratricopeptide repeat protein [Halotia branconii CENA392]